MTRLNNPRRRETLNKSLGQHFLRDPHVRRKIIEACRFSPTDTVVEIGPGDGYLTGEIIPRVQSLWAVEKDKRFADSLNAQRGNSLLHVVHSDVLDFSFTQFSSPIKIVGNLPYNAATAIIRHVISQKNHWSEAHFMIQREVAQRLSAEPRSKEYGSLSCFVQYHAKVKVLFYIKNTAFTPRPKVESAFIRLTPIDSDDRVQNEDKLFDFIQKAFQQRRKTLPNALSSITDKDTVHRAIVSLGISPELRADQISLKDYIRLFNALN